MDLETQYDRIYRYLYFRVREREMAEDLTQEAFLRFLKRTGGAAENELAYLYTIARNLCIDHFRHSKREELPLDLLPEEPSGHGPEETVIEDLALRNALQRLSAEERELLFLRYVNEVPVGALAEMYGLSRFALRRRLKQIEERLRKELT